MKEEMKKVVAEVGVAEAQKLLEKSLTRDAKQTQEKSLEGFSTSLEIFNEQELKRVYTLLSKLWILIKQQILSS